MVNPFDLTTYDLPEVSIDSMNTDTLMNQAITTHIPYLDIELPSTEVTLPTPNKNLNNLNSYVPNSKSKFPTLEDQKKVQDQLLFNELVAPPKVQDNRIAYTYNANLDLRYNKGDYDPSKDMEKIYDENQSTWDVFKKQTSRLWNNLSNSVRDNYIGQGRMVYNLGKGQFGHYDFFNKPETLASYLESINEEVYNPIYGKEGADWYSLKGWLGDTYASSGFALGAVTTGIIDSTVGQGLKKMITNPIGAGALILGSLSLFNDYVRENLTEENSNMMLGVLAGGTMSNAITGGVNKLTRSIPPASIPIFSSALKEFKNSGQYSKFLQSTIDNTLHNLKNGTVLDATSNLAKKIKVANTINKGLTAGLTGAKMYLSSGAESGMEAIQAQYDYIGEKLTEAQKEGKNISEEEYRKIQDEAKEMSKNVYNMNRLILGISNGTQFGDIISGHFVKDKLKDFGIKYIQGKPLDQAFTLTGSSLKSFYKNQIKNSLMEGIEEGSQYTISEGNKEYLRKQEQNKSQFDSYLYGLEKTLTTTEGWGNIAAGMLTSLAPSQVAAITRGISQANNGGSFKAGYTGFDKKQSEQIIERLKGQFQYLYDVTKNNEEYKGLYDAVQQYNDPTELDKDLSKREVHRQKVVDNLYNSAITAIESNNAKTMKMFLEDYFDPKNQENRQELVKVFGSEDNVDNLKKEIMNRFAKAESTIKNFQEYFNNPYTISKVDEIFENKYVTKLQEKFGIKKESVNSKKEKAAIFDSLVKGAARTMFMQDTYNDELKTARTQLNKVLENNGLNEAMGFDIRPYLLGNRNSYIDLIDNIDSQIAFLKGDLNINADTLVNPNLPKTKLSKEDQIKLEKLEAFREKLKEDKFQRYEDILRGNEEIDKEYLKTMSSPLLDLVGGYWNKAKEKGEVTDFFDESTFKNLLHDINRLEENVYFFSKDLKNFTSEKEQKQLIDYIVEQKAKFVSRQKLIKFKEDTPTTPSIPTKTIQNQTIPQSTQTSEETVRPNSETTDTRSVGTTPGTEKTVDAIIQKLYTLLDTPEIYNNWSNVRDRSDFAFFINALGNIKDKFFEEHSNISNNLILEDFEEFLKSQKITQNKEIRNKVLDLKKEFLKLKDISVIESEQKDAQTYESVKQRINHILISTSYEKIIEEIDKSIQDLNYKFSGIETLTNDEKEKLKSELLLDKQKEQQFQQIKNIVLEKTQDDGIIFSVKEKEGVYYIDTLKEGYMKYTWNGSVFEPTLVSENDSDIKDIFENEEIEDIVEQFLPSDTVDLELSLESAELATISTGSNKINNEEGLVTLNCE